MSNFGSENEANDGVIRKVYTGVENLGIVTVNPDHAGLKKIYGENTKEPNYLGTTEVDGKEVAQIRFDFFTDNRAEEGEDSITPKVPYWVSNANHISQNTGKVKYINAYGATMWLTKEEADKKLPLYEITGPKGTYKFHGDMMRPALKGEDELVDMLRNLLNLTSPEKAKKREDAMSIFSIEDWRKMFAGDFSLIRKMVEGSNNKVGFLLGAKKVENKVYQDVFTANTLRQYVKNSGKFDYLIKRFNDAKANGVKANTDFGDLDFILREYNPDAVASDTVFHNQDSTGDVIPDMAGFGQGDAFLTS